MKSNLQAAVVLFRLCLPIVATTILAGCGMRSYHGFSSTRSTATSTSGFDWQDKDKLVFNYATHDGKAALESDRVILVFDDTTFEQQRVFSFQGANQTIQVGGDGTSNIARSCATHRGALSFHSSYAGGTNTLQFGKQTVCFINGGKTLVAYDMNVELAESRKTVHLKSETVKVE